MFKDDGSLFSSKYIRKVVKKSEILFYFEFSTPALADEFLLEFE